MCELPKSRVVVNAFAHGLGSIAPGRGDKTLPRLSSSTVDDGPPTHVLSRVPQHISDRDCDDTSHCSVSCSALLCFNPPPSPRRSTRTLKPRTGDREIDSAGGSSGGKVSSAPESSSSPLTALARLRAGGIGSDGAPAIPPPLPSPLTADETLAHDRLLVLMCALQTLDPTSLESSLGFRLFLDGLSPSYAAARRCRAPTSTPTAIAANETLRDLCAGVRQEIAAALKSQSDSCRRLGWAGPFVGLQVDSTGMGGGGAGVGGDEYRGHDEVCTASVSFVPQEFDGLVRMAIGARCFTGQHASDAKKAWIREVIVGVRQAVNVGAGCSRFCVFLEGVRRKHEVRTMCHPRRLFRCMHAAAGAHLLR